jgi:hypothetical protein
MEMMSTWERRGLEQGIKQGIGMGKIQGRTEGLHDGMVTIAAQLVHRRFGVAPAEFSSQLHQLTNEALSEFAEAILDFGSVSEMYQWLNAHGAAASTASG